jgi:hypothetical protein
MTFCHPIDQSPPSAYPPLPRKTGLGHGLEGDILQHRIAKMPFIGGQPPPRHIMPWPHKGGYVCLGYPSAHVRHSGRRKSLAGEDPAVHSSVLFMGTDIPELLITQTDSGNFISPTAREQQLNTPALSSPLIRHCRA